MAPLRICSALVAALVLGQHGCEAAEANIIVGGPFGGGGRRAPNDPFTMRLVAEAAIFNTTEHSHIEVTDVSVDVDGEGREAVYGFCAVAHTESTVSGGMRATAAAAAAKLSRFCGIAFGDISQINSAMSPEHALWDARVSAVVRSDDVGLSNRALGADVAISTDGKTVVVGAPLLEADAGGRGGALILRKDASKGWEKVAELKLEADTVAGVSVHANGAAWACFGSRVAISGDGNTVALGGVGGACHAGASATASAPSLVIMFTRDTAGVWAASGVLHAHELTVDSLFGAALALDHTGDTAIVGAPRARDGGGLALMFARAGGAWRLESDLPVSAVRGANRNIGLGVAISGTGQTAAVCVHPAGDGRGSVAVFEPYLPPHEEDDVVAPSRQWMQTASLVDPLDMDADAHPAAVALTHTGAIIAVASVSHASASAGASGNDSGRVSVYVCLTCGLNHTDAEDTPTYMRWQWTATHTSSTHRSSLARTHGSGSAHTRGMDAGFGHALALDDAGVVLAVAESVSPDGIAHAHDAVVYQLRMPRTPARRASSSSSSGGNTVNMPTMSVPAAPPPVARTATPVPPVTEDAAATPSPAPTQAADAGGANTGSQGTRGKGGRPSRASVPTKRVRKASPSPSVAAENIQTPPVQEEAVPAPAPAQQEPEQVQQAPAPAAVEEPSVVAEAPASPPVQAEAQQAPPAEAASMEAPQAASA